TPVFQLHNRIVDERLYYVSTQSLTRITEGYVVVVAYLLIDLAGDVNASRRGQDLDAARDIDPAPEEVLAFLQQVSKVDADANQERLVASLAPIADSELFLDSDRGANGIHGTAEGHK